MIIHNTQYSNFYVFSEKYAFYVRIYNAVMNCGFCNKKLSYRRETARGATLRVVGNFSKSLMVTPKVHGNYTVE